MSIVRHNGASASFTRHRRNYCYKLLCDVLCVEKSDGEEGSDDSDSNDQEQQSWLAELNWRKLHPERLHEELWFNLPHEVFLTLAAPVSTKNISQNVFVISSQTRPLLVLVKCSS